LKTTLTQRLVAAAGLVWRRLGATPSERLTAFATLSCVLLGLCLRARGFLFEHTSFWLDEAAWAIFLVEEPLRELLIRPIGFMAISKGLALLFGPTEVALRTMPWLAGLATTLCAPVVASRLFSSPAARLLFVAIIALHPSAYSFAKEFKPYAISLMLHLIVLLLTLAYVQRRSAKSLGWLIATSIFGTLFAQDLVFAYPGAFLVAGHAALRTKREHLIAVVAGGVTVIVALLVQYYFFWSRIPQSANQIWGDKYQIFHVEGSYFDWFVDRYGGLAAFPGRHARYWNAPWLPKAQWEALRDVAAAVWLVVHFVGIALIVRYRRAREALLLLSPIAFVWLFNAIGRWPFGVFRANLFTLLYLAGIAGMAFDRPLAQKRPLLDLVPASVLIVIPFLLFQRGWGPPKQGLTYSSNFAELVQWLARQIPKKGKPKETVIVARECCYPWRYYVEFHPEVSRSRSKLERGFDVRCIDDSARVRQALLEATNSTTRPTWLVRPDRTHLGDLDDLTLVRQQDFGREVIVSYKRRSSP
jgi:hypothetical protein